MSPVRVLSFHAAYRCRHAGACCTSNWPIPIEADRVNQLRVAIATGRLRPAAGDSSDAIDTAPGAPTETPALLGRTAHTCVFYEPETTSGLISENATSGFISGKRTPTWNSAGRCRIHTVLGHDALPLACRQFPRVSVIDPRGVSVTLSHYCPTAAALLDADDGLMAITTDAAAFPESGEYVGLDARGAMPPLLRRDMLMDWESWWEFERLAIEQFASSVGVTAALAQLRSAVHDLQTWSPPDGPLIDRVRDAFAQAPSGSVPMPSARQLVDEVFAAIPPELQQAGLEAGPPPTERAARRYLAAHAFANWHAHGAHGLPAWLRAIESAWALLEEGAGVRQADLLLRHLAE